MYAGIPYSGSLSSRELQATHSHCSVRKYYPNLKGINDPSRAYRRQHKRFIVLFLLQLGEPQDLMAILASNVVHQV